MNHEDPEYLFHYTSAEGLYGIFKDQTVWATDSRFLNDSEEIHFSSRLVLSLFEKSLKGHQDLYLILDILKHELSVKFYPFVFSLSEDGDLLSQWRAYCPKSGGFALGFKKSEIDEICKVQNYNLKRCLYDNQSQLHLLKPICDPALQSFHKNEHQGDPDAIAKICNEMCENLTNIEPIIKHPSFKEEKEWRIVSYAGTTDFRVSTDAIIPFAKLPFSLPNDKTPPLTDRKCIGEWLSGLIVVGPSSKQELNRISVDEFLGRIRAWEIVLSETSYRVI